MTAIDHAVKWRLTMLTSAASLAVGLIYHIHIEGRPQGARGRNKTSSNTGDLGLRATTKNHTVLMTVIILNETRCHNANSLSPRSSFKRTFCERSARKLGRRGGLRDPRGRQTGAACVYLFSIGSRLCVFLGILQCERLTDRANRNRRSLKWNVA